MTSHYIKKDVDKMIIGTNSLDRFCIDNDGNVGIGTTNPSTKLEVNGNIYPTTDNSFDLGTTAKQFKDTYVENSIQINNVGITSNGSNFYVDGNLSSNDIVLLETGTITSGVDFIINDIFTTDYNVYKLYLYDISLLGFNADNYSDGFISFSSDNGSTFNGTSNVERKGWKNSSASYSTFISSFWRIIASGLYTSDTNYCEVTLYGMVSSTQHTTFYGKAATIDVNGALNIDTQIGCRTNLTSDNAIRISFNKITSIGNLVYKVYGYK